MAEVIPAFTVRVELHSATDEHYEKLHEAMVRAGFSRELIIKDGPKLQMPTAEYRLYNAADKTTEQVADNALRVAKTVKSLPAPWVLVTQGIIAYRNLPEVKATKGSSPTLKRLSTQPKPATSTSSPKPTLRRINVLTRPKDKDK